MAIEGVCGEGGAPFVGVKEYSYRGALFALYYYYPIIIQAIYLAIV